MDNVKRAPKIFQASLVQEYYFHEGCFILELVNTGQDPALSIARARVRPGATTKWHALTNTVERYVIQSGQGLVEIGEEPPQPVEPGDVVWIPADCPQRIHNPAEEDLIFLACCTPRFVPGVYRALE